MIRTFNRVSIALSIVFLLLHSYICAQDRSPAKGFQAGNAYSISDIENMNLTNGNLMLNIPLATLPGRGSSPGFALRATYDNKLWNAKQELRTDGSPDPVTMSTSYVRELLAKAGDGGWKINVGYVMRIVYRFDTEIPAQCTVENNYEYIRNGYAYKVQVSMPDGRIIEFRPYGNGVAYQDMNNDGWFSVDPAGVRHVYQYGELGGSASCNYTTSTISTTGMNYYSADGSGVRLFVPPGGSTVGWTMYLPDGQIVESTPSDDSTAYLRVSDRNNNRISWRQGMLGGISGSVIQNDVGQYIFLGQVDDSTTKIVSPGVNGEPLETLIHWSKIWVSHKYQASGARNANPGMKFVDTRWSFDVIDKITLPQQAGGLEYDFLYAGSPTAPGIGAHTQGWGHLASVKLPSGASAAYTDVFDQLDADFVVLNNSFVVDAGVDYRTLTYLSEYDGGSQQVSETTQYSAGIVVQPDGSKTLLFDGSSQGYTYYTINPNGSIDESLWAQNLAPQVSGNAVNMYPKTRLHSIPDANGNPSLTAITDYNYDKNGNVLEAREYDWVPFNSVPRTTSGNIKPASGLPSGLTLKRKIVNTYYYPTPIATDSTTNSPYIYANPSAPQLRNLIKSTELRDGNDTVVSRSEFFYDGGTTTPTRGNITQTLTWDSTKGAVTNPLSLGNSISTSATYNTYGLPLSTTDANGNVTHFTYGNVPGPNGNVADLYPTQTVAAYGTSIARTSTAVYDFYTGLVKSATDVDNGVTSATEYDDLGRPTKVITAQGTALESWTQAEYHDSDRFVVVKSDLVSKGDGKKEATQFYDQLGRVRLSKTLEDPSTQSATNETDGIKVQTRYAYDFNSGTGIGHSYKLTSNPYRTATSFGASSELTMGWTLSTGLNTGRHSEIQTFAGAGLPTVFGGGNTNSTGVVTTNIDANRTLVTDQVGKQRISGTNALGQLTDVWEVSAPDQWTTAVVFPNTSIATGYKTSYTYDTLNNLTTVNQGSQQQPRSFLYSSLSRLISATNPESGTITYGYDPNGNLTGKVDARTITTAYTYDALNRVTQRQYANEPSGSETPDVIYTYGSVAPAIGKLTKVLTGAGAETSTTEYTGFDILGRVTASKQTTSGGDAGGYTTGYSYTLSGALNTETYPSGRIVKNELNNNGTLSMVESKKDANHGYFTYADSFAYNPAGAVTTMQLGNGKWESSVFNSRLQLTQIGLGATPGATDQLKLNYDYGSTANNGDVLTQTITVPTAGLNNGFVAVQSYTYDSLNRLRDATENATPNSGSAFQSWKQTFTFDRYGNRNFDEANTTTLPKSCGSSPNFLVCTADKKIVDPAIDITKNRLSTSDSYSFDNAGNTTADAKGRTFVYDAENKQTSVSYSGGLIGQYWYDGDGKRVKKFGKAPDGQPELTIFVYDAAGKEIAEYSTVVAETSTAKVNYLTADHLGSPRINTDQNGAIIARHDYMPFGEEIDGTGGRTTGLYYGDDSVRKQFTGYEQDGESELDFAQARYHDSHLGRFSTPDPLMASGKATNPQTWNRYAYAGNNPICLTDPTGLTWFYHTLENGNIEYQWSTNDPGGNWDRVTNFTYNSHSDHGWVALDPFSSNFTEHLEGPQDAQATYRFSVAMWNTYNSWAGAGDSVSSAGSVGRWMANRYLGIDANVATNSTPHRIGWWLGLLDQTVLGAAAGGAGAAKTGVVSAAEEEVTSSGVTIIGEGMKRVNSVAANTEGAVTLGMPTFEGNADQITSQMMTYNRQWILNQMRSGRSILDIGTEPGRANPSIFYQMEKNMVQNYLQLHPNAFTVITQGQ